jgi:uncharacterized membrane protein (UPF0182 family)
LPEFKRAIAAFGSQIAMEETLDQPLQKIFGAKPAREATTPAAPAETAKEGRDSPAKRLITSSARRRGYGRATGVATVKN